MAVFLVRAISQSDKSRPRIISVILSVLASAFGVQSQQNYQRDFSEKSPLPYIITGIIVTALLVGGLMALVLFITSE
ncbi:DUF2970 domain-containing protein [Salinimonas sp. HHU 13199]|uniref:DUF2970 domain-containing protein n=1 Tax=Salinimonas profundi TaxID=2729140 RepID=A0ABR8LRS0_9ALTE|nr:DUF2970 domain-containing protein [Salinimonas profundi]MBD3586835.1 DUF2970 domain-containing protein [Salinimonas profundi]